MYHLNNQTAYTVVPLNGRVHKAGPWVAVLAYDAKSNDGDMTVQQVLYAVLKSSVWGL